MYLVWLINSNKENLPVKGFDCVFGGNLPVGAGMSSSAAVECGLLFALNEIFQFQLLRPTMATIAQKAEHTFPGVKCGIMDQFANMMGKEDHVILLDTTSLEHEYVPLKIRQHCYPFNKYKSSSFFSKRRI
jgi:galactokinase